MKNIKKLLFSTPILATACLLPTITSCSNIRYLNGVYGLDKWSVMETPKSQLDPNTVYEFRFDLSKAPRLYKPMYCGLSIYSFLRTEVLTEYYAPIKLNDYVSFYLNGKLLVPTVDYKFNDAKTEATLLNDLPKQGILTMRLNNINWRDKTFGLLEFKFDYENK